LVHRQPGIGRCVAHEAARPSVDHRIEIDMHGAFDLGAEAHLLVGLGGHDSRFRFAQRGGDFLGVVADG
jgi:hypothetical protein